jgi:S1-C subfamily serine protease
LFAPSDSEPIEFVKVQYGVPRGSKIGVSIGRLGRCYGGGFYTNRDIHFTEGRLVEEGGDYADAFFGAARAAGLDVVGDPRQLFERREDRSRAMFAVAAEITRVNMTVCNHMHWFTEQLLGKLSGESEADVVWHVYDKLQRKVVHTERTTGKATVNETPGNEVEIFVVEAFRDAARQLARSQGFRSVVAKASSGAHSDRRPTSSDRPLDVVRTAAFVGPLAQRAEHARRATVTIDLGDGHGSGFIVDARGFILTNQHVVGERERVQVRFHNGTEVTGEVLRRDKVRDVALVKIAGGDHPALPIRHTPAAIAEEVYAIGAPLDVTLSNTVTKGVVSAIRRKRDGMVYIQADVNIQGGNSGGPLVDGSGNVVGISVAGLQEDGVMTGINFFIPIQDALDRLNIKLVDGPTS